jgi:hypothetical protein
MCGGRGTKLQSRDDREWRFYSEEEKQTRDDIRSKVIGCDDIPGKTTIQHTNSERCEELNISQKSNKQNIHSGEFNSTKQQIKPGGKLNPNFVEFLMGYPMNWTKIDQTE